MRKWMPAVPIAAGYAISFSVWSRLPDTVVPDWRVILPVAGFASEPMPRAAAVFLLPTVALALWIAMAAGARIEGRLLRDAIRRFAPTYTTIVMCVVTLVLVLHALILSTVAGWPMLVPQLLGGVLGLGLLAAGNVMPRLKPNRVAGIRTAATVRDERLWLKTHRLYGIVLMAHGIIVLCLALAAPRFAFMATVLSLATAAVITQLVTRRSAATVQPQRP